MTKLIDNFSYDMLNKIVVIIIQPVPSKKWTGLKRMADKDDQR